MQHNLYMTSMHIRYYRFRTSFENIWIEFKGRLHFIPAPRRKTCAQVNDCVKGNFLATKIIYNADHLSIIFQRPV